MLTSVSVQPAYSRKVRLKVIELRVETPCWCPSEGHQHGAEKYKTFYPQLGFRDQRLFKRLLFSCELLYIRNNFPPNVLTVQIAKKSQ